MVVVFFPFLSLSQFSFRLQGGRSGAASSERLEQGATSYSCSRRSQLADDRQTKWKYQVLVSERVNERECSCCPLVVRPRTKQPKHAREPILEIVCQQEPDDNKPVRGSSKKKVPGSVITGWIRSLNFIKDDVWVNCVAPLRNMFAQVWSGRQGAK